MDLFLKLIGDFYFYSPPSPKYQLDSLSYQQKILLKKIKAFLLSQKSKTQKNTQLCKSIYSSLRI